jgi:DNA-binding NarL/FixJ family response regulator
MPNKDGRACLEEIIAIKPSAKVIMLSSVSADRQDFE